MKLMHLADLHIGKRLVNTPLYEEQAHILAQIPKLMDELQPDALLIAGDVYDRSLPSVEAVELLNEFLNQLSRRGKPVFIIAGNHDSPERLSFAGDFLRRSHIYVAPVYNGHIEPVCLQDEYGKVYVYSMPFVGPEQTATIFPDKEIHNANSAVAAVLEEMAPNPEERNVILAHQLIVGGTTCESERHMVGTLEDVDASLFDAFDYVALGHLHRPQNVGRPDGTMRYAGTPLVYSRSELNYEKSVTLIDLGPKGQAKISAYPLKPLRAVRECKGKFDELIQKGPSPEQKNDYFFIVLTDEEDVPNASAQLKERFPNMLAISYDNSRTKQLEIPELLPEEEREKRSPLELLMELYRFTHHQDMTEEAVAFAKEIIRKVEGESHEAD